MNIISSLPEYTKPKNVGLMFFCLNPEKISPYAQIVKEYNNRYPEKKNNNYDNMK